MSSYLQPFFLNSLKATQTQVNTRTYLLEGKFNTWRSRGIHAALHHHTKESTKSMNMRKQMTEKGVFCNLDFTKFRSQCETGATRPLSNSPACFQTLP